MDNYRVALTLCSFELAIVAHYMRVSSPAWRGRTEQVIYQKFVVKDLVTPTVFCPQKLNKYELF